MAVGNGCGWGVVSLNCFFELCRERIVKRQEERDERQERQKEVDVGNEFVLVLC